MTAPVVDLLNPFPDFYAKYAWSAERFVSEVLKATPTTWQLEALQAYDSGHDRISIRSGHGVGKTTFLAWLMVHHTVCRFPQKTVVTAPTTKQLMSALWAEYIVWFGRLPDAIRACYEIKAESVSHIAAPKESFTEARTSRAETPEALQGIHAPNVLLIGDEASGIPDAVFEAASGSLSSKNAIMVLAGNPVRSAGLFFDTHHKLKDSWWVRQVSCFDSPFVDERYPKEMMARYGENSNAYRVRVLGEFPSTDDDTVMSYELLMAAVHRDVLPTTVIPMVWGVDVARFGQDSSALAKRRGNALVEKVRAWSGLDTMQLAGRIKHEYDSAPLLDRPMHIYVDVIGIGAGVTDRLREWGLPAHGINVSESPSLAGTFRNLRAELWVRAKEWFAGRACTMPEDEDLINQLADVRYAFTAASGKLQVESKADMKKRGKESPDKADAFILTFAGAATIGVFGKAAGPQWNQPLRRVLKGLS